MAFLLNKGQISLKPIKTAEDLEYGNPFEVADILQVNTKSRTMISPTECRLMLKSFKYFTRVLIPEMLK